MTLSTCMQLSVNAVNVLILGYLVVYATACPTAPLVGAVIFELGFYASLLVFRLWKSRQKKSDDQIEVDLLHDKWKALGNLRKFYRLSVIGVSCTAALYLSADLSALAFARFGYLDRACNIYQRICLIATPTLHPALSMELLAGAYIESKHFEKAEKVILSVVHLREILVGSNSELMADIFANLADLYAKEKQFNKAIVFYQKSIALTKKLNLPQGYGSPMTKLASVYASQGRVSDSDAAFSEAVAIRSRVFGTNSLKVAETLQAQISALKLQKRDDQAAIVERHLSQISVTKPKSEISTSVVPIALSVASLLLLWKRDRIFLIAANLIKRHK